MSSRSRRAFIVAFVVVASVVASSCSVRQVEAWFTSRGQVIALPHARAIADEVNTGVDPVSCDPNYEGLCIPNNQPVARCLGDRDDGLEVTGPIRVIGWDHLDLDADGDGVACPDREPLGSLDIVVERGNEIVAVGWVVDPDTTAPTPVHLYDNGEGRAFMPNVVRSDVFGALGEVHGFDARWVGQPGFHEVCGYAINAAGGEPTAPNVLLGCKTIVIGADNVSYVDDISFSWVEPPEYHREGAVWVVTAAIRVISTKPFDPRYDGVPSLFVNGSHTTLHTHAPAASAYLPRVSGIVFDGIYNYASSFPDSQYNLTVPGEHQASTVCLTSNEGTSCRPTRGAEVVNFTVPG